MEKYEYICHYCGKEYVPTRRHVQLYCCTSCRVNAFNRRKKITSPDSKKGLSVPQKEDKNEQKINIAGIGNAAIANVATEFAKNIFTREENKPATKGDLKSFLHQSQQRYLPVNNAPHRNDGTKAFYDSENKVVVYRNIISSFNGRNL